MTTQKILSGLILLFFLEYLLLCLVAKTKSENHFAIPITNETLNFTEINQALQSSVDTSDLLSFQLDLDSINNALVYQLQLHTVSSKFDFTIEQSEKILMINSIRSSKMPFFKGGIFVISNGKETENKLITETLDKIASH